MGGMQQVAEVGPGERRVTAMAWLAVLVGERLVVAHVGQDVVVALLRVHDVPQILVARVASAVAGVQKLGSLIGVVEEPRALLGKVGVHRRDLLGGTPLLAAGAGQRCLGGAPPQRERDGEHGGYDSQAHGQLREPRGFPLLHLPLLSFLLQLLSPGTAFLVTRCCLPGCALL